MRKPIQQGSSESLTAHHFGPLFKGQVGRHDKAASFIGSTDDIKEQLCPRFGEGNVA